MTTPDALEPDLTAAELALRLLDGEERAAALRRLVADPAFAREVERWRRHFAALFAHWPEAEPGADVERRILATIAEHRTSARPWRWATGVSALAAAALLVALVQRPVRLVPVTAPSAPAAPPAIPLVAVLTPEGAKPFGAVFDRATGEVRLAGGVTVPSGRDAELWWIGSDGVPRALGLLPREGGGRVRVPAGRGIAAGGALAISIEPVGGAPGAAPTGPVVATGTLTAI